MSKLFLFKTLIYMLLISIVSCKPDKASKISNINDENEIETFKIYMEDNSKLVKYSELKVELADTLFLGSNIGNIIDYKPKRDDIEYLLSIIVENEYDEGIIDMDTFSDGTLTPWFGVYANKMGYKNVKGIILEEALDDTNTEFDSVLRIEKTLIQFSKRVFVIDSIFK